MLRGQRHGGGNSVAVGKGSPAPPADGADRVPWRASRPGPRTRLADRCRDSLDSGGRSRFGAPRLRRQQPHGLAGDGRSACHAGHRGRARPARPLLRGQPDDGPHRRRGGGRGRACRRRRGACSWTTCRPSRPSSGLSTISLRRRKPRVLRSRSGTPIRPRCQFWNASCHGWLNGESGSCV